MPSTAINPDQLAGDLKQWATALGFADAAISHLDLSQDLAHLRRWLQAGHHGQMAFMARDAEQRANPKRLHANTVSVICVRMNYKPRSADDATVLADGDAAYISRYALGRDYHRVMRSRLLQLGKRIAKQIEPHGYRVMADSAPLLEKGLARNAGLGWIGKHSLLIKKQAGSWFFLGELLTDLPLPAEPPAPADNLCGQCNACMRACPTQAIVAPYTVDARRCISYLTIEHRGSIPLELRPMMGNRIFGCDDCQLACPWNRQAPQTAENDFSPRHQLDHADLVDLFAWSETEWLSRTQGMALRRLDHARWLRNLAVALGNAPRSQKVLDALTRRADHPDPVVREHVQWAMDQQRSAKSGEPGSITRDAAPRTAGGSTPHETGLSKPP